ncbi:hypothetical protein [Methylobacterium aerolatum]|uniref:Uncharacterized protein n=1 Tax=Methylobacterium aerolatum TaxID=418708 RepID=A0ABU0HU43_9HYPH|nr:hypothetical protein [Methylobacterium aerolatum]MDQ0445847.1 hypothetical protein [Methylobacterium aerolatum]GJD35892.1 hypothetical protein FMGBMHLM_2805 [Methylobacterium aerolatum]
MTYRSIVLGAASLAAGFLIAGPVSAQSMMQAPAMTPAAPSATPAPAPAPAAPPVATADCQSIQKTLAERKALVGRANAASTSKQKMTPQEACSLFGKLVVNGSEGLKWISANREWCSIPDSFSEGFKADHERVQGIRTQICKVAAQATKMEAQARAQAQNGGGGGLLGGPGLSGSFKLPQGAL